MSTPAEYSELYYWLQLVLTPGVGSKTARKLLATFGSPEAIFQQSYHSLQQLVSQKQASALKNPPQDLETEKEKLNTWLEAAPARYVLPLGHTHYPQKLLETPDPPLLLYACGQLSLLNQPALAMVGSRSPSPQGKEIAADFARTLSKLGVTIVSGLALGIDGASQEAALDELGSSIAVLGTGIDRVYPASHHALAHRLSEKGLLISEYPLGTAPTPHNFSKRNRIIAGLALGTLVVEATVHSGSLITAKVAAEIGREVFAIPGSIHSPQSKGCHWLIKQGAKLVETAQDVMEELQLPTPHALPKAAPETHTDHDSTNPVNNDVDDVESTITHNIIEAMGHGPVSLDAIIARTGLDAATLQAELLVLELDGEIGRMPGNLFQRTP